MTLRMPDGAAVACLVALGAMPACSRAPEPSAGQGRVLYGQHGCASCHGADGHGDGPVGRTLDPPPRDFADASAFKNGINGTSIARTIATGMTAGGPESETPDAAPLHHRHAMPRFDHLSESERRSLALHVISLRHPTEKGTRQP